MEVRGVIPATFVRQATHTLHDSEAKHIRFLNTNVLNFLDHSGFPRNPAKKAATDPGGDLEEHSSLIYPM